MSFHVSKAAALFSLVALVAAALHAAAQTADPMSAANIYLYPRPYKIQNLVLKDSAGRHASLADFAGRVVLLHFWSIQCPACRTEEPLLEALKKAFGPGGLEILAVNLIDPPGSVASHAARNRLPFPILFDGGNGFSIRPVRTGGKQTAFLINPAQEAILDIPALPTTYIIDCRGNAIGYSVGAAQWNHRKAVELIQSLVLQSKNCQADGPARVSALPSSYRQLW